MLHTWSKQQLLIQSDLNLKLLTLLKRNQLQLPAALKYKLDKYLIHDWKKKKRTSYKNFPTQFVTKKKAFWY